MHDLQEAADVYWLNSLEGGEACLLVDSYRDLADGVALAEALFLIEGNSTPPLSCGGRTTQCDDTLRRALAGVEERNGNCGTVPPRLLQPTLSVKVSRGDTAACSDLIAFLRRLDELKSGGDRTTGNIGRLGGHNRTSVKDTDSRNGRKISSARRQPFAGGSTSDEEIKNNHMDHKVGSRRTRTKATTHSTAATAHVGRSAHSVISKRGQLVAAHCSHRSSHAPFSQGSSSNPGRTSEGIGPVTRRPEFSVSGSTQVPPPPALPPPPPPPPPPESRPQCFSVQGIRSEKASRSTLGRTSRLGQHEHGEHDGGERGTASTSERSRWKRTAAPSVAGIAGNIGAAPVVARRAAAALETRRRSNMGAARATLAACGSEKAMHSTSKRGTTARGGVENGGAATARGTARPVVASKAADKRTPTIVTVIEEAPRAKTRASGRARTVSRAIGSELGRCTAQLEKAKDGGHARAAYRPRKAEATGKRRADRREVLRWMDNLGVKVNWSLLTPEGTPCHVRFSSGELLCELAAAVDYAVSGGRGLPLSEVPSCPGRFVLRGTCGAPANAARAKHNVRASLSAFSDLGGVCGTWLRSEQAILEGDDEATWGLLSDVHARYCRLRYYRGPRSRQRRQQEDQQHRRHQQQQDQDQQPKERPRQPEHRPRHEHRHHQQRETVKCLNSGVATRSPRHGTDRYDIRSSLEKTTGTVASRKNASDGRFHVPQFTARPTRDSPERHEYSFAHGLPVHYAARHKRGPATRSRVRAGSDEHLPIPPLRSAETNRTADPIPSSLATSITEANRSKRAGGSECPACRSSPTIVSAPVIDEGGALAPGVVAGASEVGGGCRGRGGGHGVVTGVAWEAAAPVAIPSRMASASAGGANESSRKRVPPIGNGSHRIPPVLGAVVVRPTNPDPEGKQLNDGNNLSVSAPSDGAPTESVPPALSEVADPGPTREDLAKAKDTTRASTLTKGKDARGDFQRSRQAGAAASAETATWLRWDPSFSGKGTVGYVWGESPRPPDGGSLSCGARRWGGRIPTQAFEGGKAEVAISARAAPPGSTSSCVDSDHLRPVTERPQTLFDDQDKVCRRSPAKQSGCTAPVESEPREEALLSSERSSTPFDEIPFVRTALKQVPGEEGSHDNPDDVGAFHWPCRGGEDQPLFRGCNSFDGVPSWLMCKSGLADDAGPGVGTLVPVPTDPFARSLTSDLFPVAHQSARFS
ncbi:unnamed protein product [Scytosiphon promiscuus]